MMSSIVPVVPKKTSGARDFRLMLTGIATNAPKTENTHVPSALQRRIFVETFKTYTFEFVYENSLES